MITLSSGRRTYLSQVWMTGTYDGLIEGYPFRYINDRMVANLPQQGAHRFPGSPVHVIPPIREYPEAQPGRHLPFGPEELLPRVICVGMFESSAVDTGPDAPLYRSRLVVVWMQPTAVLPSDETAGLDLRDLPWDEMAKDEEI
ncbi:hypothetical protein [Pseudofrankia sp. EUN1h]|uniref:hypothetical protein n=2 Tax=Pseudofrankia TaxID=2994363 RepID=UPI0012FF5303|nr:hypothetical protein [Pseudofrankia sp. EUN1h]